MEGCTHKADCPLFGQFQMEQSLKIWRLLYCDTEEKFKSCARFEAALKGEVISPTLLPNGTLTSSKRRSASIRMRVNIHSLTLATEKPGVSVGTKKQLTPWDTGLFLSVRAKTQSRPPGSPPVFGIPMKHFSPFMTYSSPSL